MNTSITYMYRDGANYNESQTVIVAGTVTREQLLECCDQENSGGDSFIPDQVGLDELQHRMINFPNDQDHVWHELLELEPTKDEPTIEMTAEQLLKKFQEAKGNWNIVAAVDRLGLV